MCVQFDAIAIVMLREPAAMFLAGQILCMDEAGNWYWYIGPATDQSHKASGWPPVNKRTGAIRLYRDYWRYCAWAPDSEYGRRLTHAEKNLLRGDRKLIAATKPRKARRRQAA